MTNPDLYAAVYTALDVAQRNASVTEITKCMPPPNLEDAQRFNVQNTLYLRTPHFRKAKPASAGQPPSASRFINNLRACIEIAIDPTHTISVKAADGTMHDKSLSVEDRTLLLDVIDCSIGSFMATPDRTLADAYEEIHAMAASMPAFMAERTEQDAISIIATGIDKLGYFAASRNKSDTYRHLPASLCDLGNPGDWHMRPLFIQAFRL